MLFRCKIVNVLWLPCETSEQSVSIGMAMDWRDGSGWQMRNDEIQDKDGQLRLWMTFLEALDDSCMRKISLQFITSYLVLQQQEEEKQDTSMAILLPKIVEGSMGINLMKCKGTSLYRLDNVYCLLSQSLCRMLEKNCWSSDLVGSYVKVMTHTNLLAPNKQPRIVLNDIFPGGIQSCFLSLHRKVLGCKSDRKSHEIVNNMRFHFGGVKGPTFWCKALLKGKEETGGRNSCGPDSVCFLRKLFHCGSLFSQFLRDKDTDTGIHNPLWGLVLLFKQLAVSTATFPSRDLFPMHHQPDFFLKSDHRANAVDMIDLTFAVPANDAEHTAKSSMVDFPASRSISDRMEFKGDECFCDAVSSKGIIMSGEKGIIADISSIDEESEHYGATTVRALSIPDAPDFPTEDELFLEDDLKQEKGCFSRELSLIIPIHTGSRKRKEAEFRNKPDDVEEVEDDNGSCNYGEKPAVAKRVRFSLKHNLVWRPHCPLPPESLRVPPSAMPRGSALKKGVPPGPISTMKKTPRKKASPKNKAAVPRKTKKNPSRSGTTMVLRSR